MMPKLRAAPATRVAVAVDDDGFARDVTRVLAGRGVGAEGMDPDAASARGGHVIAHAPARALTIDEIASLAELCADAAEDGRPVVSLIPPPPAGHRRAAEHAAGLAVLRAHGAVLCADPDAWFEALVLLSCFGAPPGPRAAIVAPPGTWLAASALALEAEASARGDRFASIADDAGTLSPVDAVLVDRSELAGTERATRQVLLVPVVARPELAGERPALVGLRAALAAVEAVGRQRERVAAGLGPADEDDDGDVEVAIDRERLERQLDKLGERAGDHESKVLLSCYGVRVTRQAVATTPSGATRIAKKAGFPVELKPWGAEIESEPEGCPVETDVASNADVRRAYAAICDAAEVDAVIVRETPPRGRELSVRIEPIGALGLMLVAEVEGAAAPVAAVAPCRPIDAEEVARRVVSSRAGDPAPNRRALVELLVRSSRLAADVPRLESLELPRVIVGPDEVVVVDARCRLRRRR